MTVLIFFDIRQVIKGKTCTITYTMERQGEQPSQDFESDDEVTDMSDIVMYMELRKRYLENRVLTGSDAELPANGMRLRQRFLPPRVKLYRKEKTASWETLIHKQIQVWEREQNHVGVFHLLKQLRHRDVSGHLAPASSWVVQKEANSDGNKGYLEVVPTTVDLTRDSAETTISPPTKGKRVLVLESFVDRRNLNDSCGEESDRCSLMKRKKQGPAAASRKRDSVPKVRKHVVIKVEPKRKSIVRSTTLAIKPQKRGVNPTVTAQVTKKTGSKAAAPQRAAQADAKKSLRGLKGGIFMGEVDADDVGLRPSGWPVVKVVSNNGTIQEQKWRKRIVQRVSGTSRGRLDRYWYTPIHRYQFRSLVAVRFFLEMFEKKNLPREATSEVMGQLESEALKKFELAGKRK
jgi:Methyl-CpG binding domain